VQLALLHVDMRHDAEIADPRLAQNPRRVSDTRIKFPLDGTAWRLSSMIARTSSPRILVHVRRCMANTFLQVLVATALTGLAGCCLTSREPPGGDYKRVSELVRFPDFYPGLGRLYVQPKTLPLGPFRAYDRQGFLVSTIYMVPIKDLDAHKMLEIVEGTPVPVDHVDIHYTSGHPGVEVPHYHIILWHASPERATSLR
jgi:hypothetical protein